MQLLTAPAVRSQEVKLPSEIKVAKPGAWFIVAPEVVSGGQPKWRVDPGLEEQRLDTLFELPAGFVQKGKIFAGDSGRYKIEVWNAKGDTPSDIVTCWVTIGTPSPPPVVVVPPVDPPDPPTPPVPPQGPRHVTIIREGHEQTPQFADLIKSLRSGAGETWLTERGHSLFIVDDDQKGPDGQPTYLVAQWRQILGGLTLPVMVVHDPKTRHVISKRSLDKTASDPQIVLDALQAAGG